MSDHRERACPRCGSLLHSLDACIASPPEQPKLRAGSFVETARAELQRLLDEVDELERGLVQLAAVAVKAVNPSPVVTHDHGLDSCHNCDSEPAAPEPGKWECSEETAEALSVAYAEAVTRGNRAHAMQRALTAVLGPEIDARDKTIAELRAENERLIATAGLDRPWPLRDTLRQLARAAHILLHDLSYDGHGHGRHDPRARARGRGRRLPDPRHGVRAAGVDRVEGVEETVNATTRR